VIYEVDPSNKEEAADRQEVANYVRALEYGLMRLKKLPVSLRLMREVHKALMRGAEDRRPGEFRINSKRYIPFLMEMDDSGGS
jgi:Fic family protein